MYLLDDNKRELHHLQEEILYTGHITFFYVETNSFCLHILPIIVNWFYIDYFRLLSGIQSIVL